MMLDSIMNVASASFHMIHSISISNFRCYKHLSLEGCARLNVIVGDNGSGKTTLLEALFITLASNTEVAARLRGIRGVDGSATGSARRVEDAIWGDFFHNNDFSRPIKISLTGDGLEARSLEVARGISETVLPLGTSIKVEPSILEPITFTWTDSRGIPHRAIPTVSTSGITLPGTGEGLPDFFMIPSATTIGSVENATRFSELSKAYKSRRFIKTFSREYDWIKDIDVEVHAGLPMLFVTLRSQSRKIPITNVSGAINRMIGVMLTIVERDRSVVLLDEIENGIYYTHLEAMWRIILSLLRESGTQMFVTTHSKECLEALVSAAGNNVGDISLWRTDRSDKDDFSIFQFSGEDLRAGIEYGQEVR